MSEEEEEHFNEIAQNVKMKKVPSTTERWDFTIPISVKWQTYTNAVTFPLLKKLQ